MTYYPQPRKHLSTTINPTPTTQPTPHSYDLMYACTVIQREENFKSSIGFSRRRLASCPTVLADITVSM
jgi:hypothetical protein